MTTIFSKIINREIAGQFVYEDELCVVLMDKFPAVEGQTLVIPKVEVDYIFDLPEHIYKHLFEIAQKIALASDKAFATKRTCLVVEGFEVPHAHIKLYPMQSTDKNLGTIIPQQKEQSDEELEENAKKILEQIK